VKAAGYQWTCKNLE